MRFMKDVILNGLPSDCQKVNCPDQTKPSYIELEMMIHNKYYKSSFLILKDIHLKNSNLIMRFNFDVELLITLFEKKRQNQSALQY